MPPTAPLLNDGAKPENPFAIVGSYVMTSELLPQSHAFSPIQNDVYSLGIWILVVGDEVWVIGW
ncbi:hypothetical protein [Calothrix sp. UHCC 0171]|uniref:hypothetical protein n=1 Tax=Calothrix sp. UHCC 0171 TaxID=3110245 RepID=UPI002B2040FC|nr:hypothetical protein [Calothrix sp. UHCC 0171]MEA5572404.1 hypothetical protein [Calothrix sp. UHCC 0171]